MKTSSEDNIIKGLSDFLSFLGIEENANTLETPRRMLLAWQEMCRGLGKELEIKKILSVTFPSKYTGMVSQGPVIVYSLCSHHLLPVFYEIFVGYIPKRRVIGFSKISKAIALIAAKPQNQEDLTQEIADTFRDHLKPEGFGIVVKGKHLCMFCRSSRVHYQDALNITSAVRGSFRKNAATKEEFFKNITFISNSK